MSSKQKIAIVTGGARGIGRACCVELARQGAAVAVWDLDGEAAQQTVQIIEEEGNRAHAFIGDAAERTEIDRILGEVRSLLGPVLILVNNAGIVAVDPFLEITPDKLERIYRVNLMGPFFLTQAALPDMLATGWGRIINISSSSAQTGAKFMAHYSSSKGGIIALTRTLAVEFAAQGITVNTIPPGYIDTPMTRGTPIDFDAVTEASPMKRMGRPEEIAAACAFLASEGAGYITGQVLGVNGGRVIG